MINQLTIPIKKKPIQASKIFILIGRFLDIRMKSWDREVYQNIKFDCYFFVILASRCSNHNFVRLYLLLDVLHIFGITLV